MSIEQAKDILDKAIKDPSKINIKEVQEAIKIVGGWWVSSKQEEK